MEGSEAADQMVRTGIQLTDTSIRLLASGGKNLLALLLALARDNKKLMGKTNMNRLLREQRPMTLFRIKEEDYPQFQKRAKQYGILFSAVRSKVDSDGLLTVISNTDYLSQINYLMETLGYPAPVQEETIEKKADPRVPQKSYSQERGNGLKKTQTPEITTSDKPSVKSRLEALRAASSGLKDKEPTRTYDPTR